MGLYGSSSSSGGLYGSSHHSSEETHHNRGLLHDLEHGFGGFATNFLGDVRDSAVGLPMGLVGLATHPISALENMGKTTWQDWSPLFHGHPGQFAHNFYDHPLAPLLDVAAVFTGGAGLAAKATNLATRAEVSTALAAGKDLSETSRMARFGRAEDIAVKGPEGSPDMARHLDANPAVKLRQRATHALGRDLAERSPKWFGRFSEEQQYGRLMAHDRASRAIAADHIKAGVHAQIGAIFAAGKVLTEHPQEAYSLTEKTMRDSLEHHAHRLSPDKLLAKTKAGVTTLRPGAEWRFIKAKTPGVPRLDGVDSLEKALKSFGARHTTRDINLAKRDAEGNVLLVSDHTVRAYGEEAANSSKFVKLLYKRPTKAWKWMILATRPAFLVNNAVGNTFMAMASLGPVGFSRGFVDAIRQTHGESAAIKSLQGADRAAGKALGSGRDVIDKWYMGVHQEGFGLEAQQALSLHLKLKGKVPDKVIPVAKHIEQGLYPLTHKIAEKFMRRIGINELLRRSPEVRGLMDGGMSFSQAVDRASANPAFRSRIQEQMNNILGQYHYLNRTEMAVRELVPFYTWDRAIMRHGVHLAIDRPGRAAAGAALGQAGVADTEAKLGDIPDFMKGLIPLGGKKVLSTQGVNPYSSIPDVAETVGALVGVGPGRPGEAIASQVNPLLTGLVESTTGQSLLSGAKLPHRPGGIIGQTAANVVEALPQAKIIQTLLGGEMKPKPNKRTGKTKPFLYRKNARAQIAAMLGVPVKEVSKEAAHELSAKQHGGSKKKKRTTGHGLYG